MRASTGVHIRDAISSNAVTFFLSSSLSRISLDICALNCIGSRGAVGLTGYSWLRSRGLIDLIVDRPLRAGGADIVGLNPTPLP